MAEDAPSSKRQRVHSDRVTLNVGGSRFETSKSTLIPNSRYFARQFDDSWSGSLDPESPLFLDLDPDCFRILLSCMRRNLVLLPEKDADLCTRALLDAEFLGIDWLLAEVKVTVQQHMHPDDESVHTPQAFDAEYGSLQEAIIVGVLPARFYRAPPAPPKPRIKQLIAGTESKYE